MAGSAFTDAEVIKALANFTPILIDGDTEKEVCRKYGANGWPHTAFADMKGEQVGQPIVGAVPKAQFLQKAQEFAKKIKPGKPSKDFATLTAAQADLTAAMTKKHVAASLAAIAKIEKVNRPGAILDAALAAKKELMDAGQARVLAAKTSAEGGDKAVAVKDLRKLAQEYKGTDLGAEAAKLAQEFEPPAK